MSEKYLLIAKGSEEEFRAEFNSFDEAMAERVRRVQKLLNETSYTAKKSVKDHPCMIELTADEQYQMYDVVKKPTSHLEQAMLELELACAGLQQYAHELEDTWTCAEHLDKLTGLIKVMKGENA